MSSDPYIEIESKGEVQRVDLAEIDQFVAEISAGPGENPSENIFDAFVMSELASFDAPAEFLEDDAGIGPSSTASNDHI